MTEKIGAVMVLGGGVAGIQTSLDLADSGFKVYLVEQQPSIGGTMTQLDKTFPTNDCAMCILAPKLVGASRHPNIGMVTHAELVKVEGDVGHFRATLKKKARHVDPIRCTGCGICAQRCPVSALDRYNLGLGVRGAVYISSPQAVPLVYGIDREKCIGCGICHEVCEADAILYDEEDVMQVLDVGSIVLALGSEPFDPGRLSAFGYGSYPNVVTSLEFERILSATGPYRGTVMRPSDGELPKRVAFIQCVGSRDERIGNSFCSGVCCMYAIKEAVIAQEHSPGLESTVFYIDIRAYGKDFERYLTRAEKEYGVTFIRSRVSHLEEEPESHDVIVTYLEDNVIQQQRYDMAVLSIGLRAPRDAEKLSKVLGFELNSHGFCRASSFHPVETTRTGVYVCGTFSSPKDIPETVAQASAAALKASRAVYEARNTLTAIPESPVKREVGGPPRIGVFVCHCGINIGGVVSVPDVIKYAETLPDVVYAEGNLYTCSQDTQRAIREKILQHDLNRVVVASCTPRTHEPLFQDTLTEAGLNPYLFEMANIRDQCSWVHMHEPEAATEKAKALVRMAVAKARLLQPLEKPRLSVVPVALVIGGGLAGMTASLELAAQGFQIHLVEKEDELGGNLRSLRYLLDGDDPQSKLKELVDRVHAEQRIRLHLGSEVSETSGYIGNFETRLAKNDGEESFKHGVVIVATGGKAYKPEEYLYREDRRVVTQLEFEEMLWKKQVKVKTLVMIQCVGSRCDERPYCSRICCSTALKNAVQLKETDSDAEVYILYRDMRTYGFIEDNYREAAAKGVVFIRYEQGEPPVVTNDGGLKVSVRDPVLGESVMIRPDYVVLSTAIIAPSENAELSRILKVPLNRDGFFLEAHMKLRPLDFATDGIFLCGSAHGPKSIQESIIQALGAAARAITILSKPFVEAEAIYATVDEDLCSGCKLCQGVCEFGAIEMHTRDSRTVSHVVKELCKGCGVCSSTCPSSAIALAHFTDRQIMSQIQAALAGARL